MKSATDLTSLSENGEGPQYWSEHGALLAPSSEIKQIKVLKIINVNIKCLSSKPLTMLLNLVIKLPKKRPIYWHTIYSARVQTSLELTNFRIC